MKAGGHVIADITTEGQTFVAAQGGMGGLGNAYFKTATERRPKVSTEGAPGEEKVVELELKTIADIGLVSIYNFWFLKVKKIEVLIFPINSRAPEACSVPYL